jgi:hypothetical protein
VAKSLAEDIAMWNRKCRRCSAAVGLSVALTAALAPGARALTFNFIHDAGMDPNALLGFTMAGNRWSSLFSDPITVNIQIDFRPLGAGILGQTGSQTIDATYADVRNALIGDAKSANDATAVAHLQAGPALTFLTNNTTGATVLDSDGSANNTDLDFNRANAKALGLLSGSDAGLDASITFSSTFSFDFDPTNGISGGFDFVGVATHEIGHALGFLSGVDIVDAFSGPNLAPGVTATDLNSFRVFSALDLYRYSNDPASIIGGNKVLDLRQGRTGQSNAFFSLDGGTTNLGLFSTGDFNGDGNQASHWKDGQGLGLMDPTLAPGELGVISALDTTAFDAIGYDPRSRVIAVAPEPGTLGLMALPLVGAALVRVCRRRS